MIDAGRGGNIGDHHQAGAGQRRLRGRQASKGKLDDRYTRTSERFLSDRSAVALLDHHAARVSHYTCHCGSNAPRTPAERAD